MNESWNTVTAGTRNFQLKNPKNHSRCFGQQEQRQRPKQQWRESRQQRTSLLRYGIFERKYMTVASGTAGWLILFPSSSWSLEREALLKNKRASTRKSTKTTHAFFFRLSVNRPQRYLQQRHEKSLERSVRRPSIFLNPYLAKRPFYL